MENLTYEQAVNRLETLVASLENGEMELDHLSGSIREAQELLAFCKDKLAKVETDVKELLDDEQE